MRLLTPLFILFLISLPVQAKLYYPLSHFEDRSEPHLSSENPETKEARFISAWELMNGIRAPRTDSDFLAFISRLKSESVETVLDEAVLFSKGTFLTSFSRSVGSTFVDPQKGTQAPLGDFIFNWMKLFETNESIESLTLSGEAYFPFDGKALIPFTWQQKFFEKWDNSLFRNSDFYRLSKDDSKSRRLRSTYLNEETRLGLFTTQQYSKILFEAGTNRRAVIHLIEDWNCRPVSQLMDFTLPDLWVGRDVDRRPGGNSEVYISRCIGCHAGMDALRGAFARVDFANDTLYNSARIHPKMSSNSDIFPYGHQTESTDFKNFWIQGPSLGQDLSGPRDFMEILMRSPDFGSCMVKRIAQQLCPASPISNSDAQTLSAPYAGVTRLRTLAIEVTLKHCLKGSTP
jgi:hypothetical protein